MLLRLVTLEGTRARRSGEELLADARCRPVLDALVRGRLLVAQDAEQGGAFELAHEVLVQGWGTLRGWLLEEAERRVQREGLATRAAEWARGGRSPELLLGRGQLREAEALSAEDLTPLEAELLSASSGAARRRRARRSALAVLVPVLAAVIWLAAAHSATSETARKVELLLDQGRAALSHARATEAEAQGASAAAFPMFDRGDPGAEPVWARAVAASKSADGAYAAASRALEAAAALAPQREELRDELADVLYTRAALADAWHEDERRDELAARFELHDRDGSRQRRWLAPAKLSLRTHPAGARVRLLSAGGKPGAPALELGEAPLDGVTLAPGSWLLEAEAEGRATTRLAVLAHRGEELDLELALPAAEEVPVGFVLVPAGRFLYGSSADEELRRGFFNAQPEHAAMTGAFLVARREITFGEWIAWLTSLPPAERGARLPEVSAGPATPGSVHLRESAGGYRLELRPGALSVAAGWGEPLVYPQRPGAAGLDWRKLPVTGVSARDVEAYASWLSATGRVPGARLCTEREWERAARGADGRPYPGGAELTPDAANYDATHGQGGAGPDPVGSYPASRSPYGLDDASGNAFELTRAEEGAYAARGGSYWHDRKTAQLANREPVTASLRDASLGARLCATVGAP